MNVYHFTDTARLPWILVSGYLKAGRNRIDGYPEPDFIWATVNSCGDRMSSADYVGGRTGKVLAVRFTCRAADFQPWTAQTWRRYPSCTVEHVSRLEESGRARGSRPEDWYYRPDPLPLADVVAIDTKPYRDPSWRSFKGEPIAWLDGYLGVEIRNVVYLSRPFDAPTGAQGYEITHGFREPKERPSGRPSDP
jgi:hypothetical protein